MLLPEALPGSAAPAGAPNCRLVSETRLPVEKFAAGMTHDILQTDIDLATRLRDDHRSDEEIILALVHRGVDPAKAAQLVDDLRNGRKPTVRIRSPAGVHPAAAVTVKEVARETGQSPPTRSSEPDSRRERRAQPAAQGRKKSAVIWLAAVALVGLVDRGGRPGPFPAPLGPGQFSNAEGGEGEGAPRSPGQEVCPH